MATACGPCMRASARSSTATASRLCGPGSTSAATRGSRATSGAVRPRPGRRPRGSAGGGSRSGAAGASCTARSRGSRRCTGSRTAASPTSPPGSIRWCEPGPARSRSTGTRGPPRSSLRYPLGDRTPFAEIRRLRPYVGPRPPARPRVGYSARRGHGPRSSHERRLDAGADAWVEALRGTLAPLGPHVLCPLSGGRDSRMLLCALPDRGEALALTVGDDEGGVYEEERATRVASALGVRHELIGARAEDYPRDWDQRAAAVEYQFVDHAWLMPLAHRLAGAEEPVLDGLAIDTLFAAGERFYIGDAIDTSRPRVATGALFDTLRQFGHAERALEPAFEAPLVARARDQFVAELRPFEGHSSQVILGTYCDPHPSRCRGLSDEPARDPCARDRPRNRRRPRPRGPLDPAAGQAGRDALQERVRAAGPRGRGDPEDGRRPEGADPPASAVALRRRRDRVPRAALRRSPRPSSRPRDAGLAETTRREASSTATCAWGWSRSPYCTPGAAATATSSATSTRPRWPPERRRRRRTRSRAARSLSVARQLRVDS